jgi:hypothetical protein
MRETGAWNCRANSETPENPSSDGFAATFSPAGGEGTKAAAFVQFNYGWVFYFGQ